MARARHGMCELKRHGVAGERYGIARARHGHGMECVNEPLYGQSGGKKIGIAMLKHSQALSARDFQYGY
jgi:hypothetical protein